MLNMKNEVKFLGWMMFALVITSGCQASATTSTKTPQPISPPLTPFQVKTNPPTVTATPIITPTEQSLFPSPTPFKHVVQPGDTLFWIALKYNISLDRLVLANPDIDTSILTVGIQLNIPFEADEDLSIPTPTPYPVSVNTPICLLTNDGGMWCFSDVHNDQGISLENISAALNLYNDENKLVQSYIAIPPLNYLFPDQTIPLSAFIPPPLPEGYQVTAILITSLPSGRNQALTEILDPEIRYNEDKTIAEITGSVRVEKFTSDENQVWVAAVAYSDGFPVGIRKWISAGELQPGEDIVFEMYLYSLGPPIDKIQLFSELH